MSDSPSTIKAALIETIKKVTAIKAVYGEQISSGEIREHETPAVAVFWGAEKVTHYPCQRITAEVRLTMRIYITNRRDKDTEQELISLANAIRGEIMKNPKLTNSKGVDTCQACLATAMDPPLIHRDMGVKSIADITLRLLYQQSGAD